MLNKNGVEMKTGIETDHDAIERGMNMSMADTTWYVVENTGSERRIPQLARIQFVVHISTESEFDHFNKALSEKDKYAYKDSYRPYFKHDPHINDTPMSVAQFCQMI